MTTLYQQTEPAVLRQNDLQKAIHQHHWQERKALIESIDSSAHKRDRSLARRLASCGQVARLWLDPAKGKVVTVITRCGVRICPWCTHHRTAHATAQILAIMSRMKEPRTIVLTARSTELPLMTQLAKLRADFKRLRRTKEWKDHNTGGVYTLEVTYNPRASTWHPHVHLITEGKYFPQALLSKLWKQATGDSDITWIQKADNAHKAAIELAGYIGKPAKIKDLPIDKLMEYIHATRGLRMLQTFGACRSAAADDADPKREELPPNSFLTLNRIRFLAYRGQTLAVQLAKTIPQRWPIFRRFFDPQVEDLPPPQGKSVRQDFELLDASIFIDFTMLLRARDAGDLDLYDIYDTL